MALVRLGRLDHLASLTQLSQLLAQQKALPAGNGPMRVAPPEGVKKNSPTPAEAPSGPVALTAESLPQVWAQTLATLASSGPGGALLVRELEKAAIPAISGPNSLVLRFPAAYNQAQDFGQDANRLRRLEEALRKMTGRPWTLRVESVATAADLQAPAVSESVTLPPRRSPREEAEKVPLVKRALEVFGATVQRVDEGFGALPGTSAIPADAPVVEEKES
jgi:hypothetical protein